MYSLIRVSLLLISFLTVTKIFAQEKPVIPGKKGMAPSFVSFKAEAAPDFSRGMIHFTDDNGTVNSREKAVELNYQKDVFGLEHVRYQQYIKGIPVEHGIYVVHAKNGKVSSQNGVWIKDIPTKLEQGSLKEASALEFALNFVGAKKYKWQDPNEEKFLKREQNNPNASFFPKGEMVFYSGEDDVIPDELRPAYKFDIYAEEPLSRQIIFVDAVNGNILGKREIIHQVDVNGTAETAYSGNQTIKTELNSGNYRLRETGRGNGVNTYNLQKGTSYSSAVDFLDNDNTWNNVNSNLDEYATDAHWGGEMTYDYYKNKYGRNSIDGNGFAINSYVHYSKNYFNAFWDGSRMTYGDGSSTNGYKPLTSLDVCGHEITHGLTSKTSNLTYSNESGAMNEAFSDIFGTSIEFYARPTKGDWLIGGDFYTIRSMSKPNDYSDPDTYKGTYWYTGTSDNGGVHTNSGVLNYWYYLLVNGGSGTNDNNFAFSVSGLGIDKAGMIAYATLTSYLTSTSKFADARTLSIQAAQSIYGPSSNEVAQTINAWDAVGVVPAPPPPPCNPNVNIYEPNESLSAAYAYPINEVQTAYIGTSTDKDWYTFTTSSLTGTNIKIDLTYLPADYDMKLYNSSGRAIATSRNSGTNDESIKLNTSSSAKYYLQVYGYAGAFSSTKCYALKITTSGTALFNGLSQVMVSFDKVNAEVPTKLSVYPNPVSNILKVDIPSDQSRDNEILLMDITGRMVLKEKNRLVPGVNHFELNISSLKPGVYLLKTNDQPLIKIHILK